MPSSVQMQSISGIITQIHTTTGEIPPPLVGTSVDIIDNRAYVFAGRVAESRNLTNSLYILDLETLIWTQHIPSPDSDKPPKPRYFHSTSIYKNQLVIFGGMSQSTMVSNDGLCVLDDVMLLDLETLCWKKPDIQPSLYSPQARYAHLSSIVDDKLVIIGGQDLDNNYLDELNVLNLKTWEWEQMKTFEKHVGAYRSVAVTAPSGTRIPTATLKRLSSNTNNSNSDAENSSNNNERPSSLQSLEEANPICLYTNYNFTDVKRELQFIFPSIAPQVAIEDCSTYMNGSVMPPGLRFPTGHTLGNHLILAGTYLTPQSQSYTIWSLDLIKLTWSRIETGAVFNTGSWNRGALHEKSNRFIIFGNTDRNLLDDYNHRQINFNHMAHVDVEAFGIYALPKTTCSSLAQEMGLRLLNEPAVSDFNIITQDNITIPVNSAVLAQRWPYFANLMKDNHVRVQQASGSDEQKKKEETTVEEEKKKSSPEKEATIITLIKSRYMSFPYPHAVVLAFLQFIYTDNLLTAQQYQPHILSQLLLLSDMYDIPRLCELATHALHQMLNMSTAPLIFETAALSHQTSLQIRALKMMIAAKRMIQQQQLQEQQLRQQEQSSVVIRSRAVSTPALVASSSNLIDPQFPMSPTASVSSSSEQRNSRISNMDSSFTSSSRKSSLNYGQQRASYVRNNTYNSSPPITPGQPLSFPSSELDLHAYTPRRSSSPPPNQPSSKPKKKKKAFFEAFGKLSSSIYNSTHHHNNN